MAGATVLRALLSLVFAAIVPSTAIAVDVQSFKLAKGEDVWFVSDHTLPMIALTAALPAGSSYDPAAKPGLASFAASLADEGAGKLNATAFQTALSNRAIRLSITPDRDFLIVSLVTLTDNAKDAFQLLGLALSQPRFDQDAVQRVRAQILSSLAQQEEEPDAVAAKAFFRTFFHEQPYGHAVAGDTASISAINVGDLKAFAASHWVGGGLKIAVSGDFDKAQLTQLLKSAFGALPLKTPPMPPPVNHAGQPGVQVVPMPIPQPTAVFGLPGPMRSDPDFIPGYVANYILGGGGFASRLTNEVREKRGLTYDISTSLDSFRRSGAVLGEVASKRGAMKQTIDVIRQTMRDYTANGPTQTELDDAKTYLTGSFPLAFGSNVGISSQLNAFQRVGLSVDYVKKRNALIGAVTLDDVARVSKRLFNPAKLTFVVAGSLDSAPAAASSLPAARATPTALSSQGAVKPRH
jgi:zinc protease